MLRKICNILATCILSILLVLAGLLVVPPLMGYQSLAVLSGSMEPNIGVGAIVYTRAVEEEDLEVGDVVTYRLSGDTLVTHRVVKNLKDERCVITQGDANDVVDGSPVAYDDIVGRVDFHVPLLGYISMYVKTPLGMAIGCGLLLIMIILSFLPDILGGEKKEESNVKI